MNSDYIIEVGIDNLERLYIKPAKQEFLHIYRSAMEVHWDIKRKYLYSPKPREWTYFRWFIQIISASKAEYRCLLLLTNNTKWINISEKLQKEIIDFLDNNYSAI